MGKIVTYNPERPTRLQASASAGLGRRVFFAFRVPTDPFPLWNAQAQLHGQRYTHMAPHLLNIPNHPPLKYALHTRNLDAPRGLPPQQLKKKWQM